VLRQENSLQKLLGSINWGQNILSSISTPHVMIYCAIPICGKVYFIPLKRTMMSLSAFSHRVSFAAMSNSAW
jgi:hypothetical protein